MITWLLGVDMDSPLLQKLEIWPLLSLLLEVSSSVHRES